MGPHEDGQGAQGAVLARTGPAWEEEGLLNSTTSTPTFPAASSIPTLLGALVLGHTSPGVGGMQGLAVALLTGLDPATMPSTA